MPAPKRQRHRLRVGDSFESGNPTWGRAHFVIVQTLPDGGRVAYRTNKGARDERERWYILGGEVRGIRRMGEL